MLKPRPLALGHQCNNHIYKYLRASEAQTQGVATVRFNFESERRSDRG